MSNEPVIGSVWSFTKAKNLCFARKVNSSWERIVEETIKIPANSFVLVIGFKEDYISYQEIILLFQNHVLIVFRAAFEDFVTRKAIKKIL